MNILQIFNELYLYLLVFLRMVVYFQTYVSSFHECDSILTEKFRKAVNWEYTSEYSVDYPGMYSLYTHEKEKKLFAFCKKHPDYKITLDLLLQALEIDMDSWNSYYDGKKVVKAPKREVFSGGTNIYCCYVYRRQYKHSQL